MGETRSGGGSWSRGGGDKVWWWFLANPRCARVATFAELLCEFVASGPSFPGRGQRSKAESGSWVGEGMLCKKVGYHFTF